MIPAERVIEEARGWVGTPFRHQGRSRDGVDCVGVLVVVARALGIPHVDRVDYGKFPVGNELVSHLRSNLLLPSAPGKFPGQVALFREQHFPCHVGLLSWLHGTLHVIHARADRRKVVEEPVYATERKALILRTFDLPGVEPWLRQP